MDALRLFQRVQVLALDVLDQGHFQCGLVRHVADQHGYTRQAGQLASTPAAFAGNDLVAPARYATRQYRLHQTL